MNSLFKKRIILRNTQGMQFILKAELVYLKGSGSYTDYFVRRNGDVKCITQTGNLALHEAKLDDRFLRISKSCIVNLDFVDHIFNNRKLLFSIPISEILIISTRYWKLIRKLGD